MLITVEATYEGGVLKLRQPLPLDEHETVRVTVQTDKAGPTGNSGLTSRNDPLLIERAAKEPGTDVRPSVEEPSPLAETEMLNLWLDIPRSPTARTITVQFGKPILPAPFEVDESDLAPE